MKVNGMDFKWKSFRYYGDCGHGWLKVSYNACYRLGILRMITSYSYMRNGYLYLEEDCDAPLFINALKKYNIQYKINWHYCNNQSKIRSYNSYSCGNTYDNDNFFISIENKIKNMF